MFGHCFAEYEFLPASLHLPPPPSLSLPPISTCIAQATIREEEKEEEKEEKEEKEEEEEEEKEKKNW